MKFKTLMVQGLIFGILSNLMGQNNHDEKRRVSHFGSIGDDYGYYSITLFDDSTFETFQTTESNGINRLGLGNWKSIGDSVELVFKKKIGFSDIVDSVFSGYHGPFHHDQDTFLLMVVDRDNKPVESFQVLSFRKGVSYHYLVNDGIGSEDFNLECHDKISCYYGYTDKQGLVGFEVRNKDSLDFLSVSFIENNPYALPIAVLSPVLVLKLKFDSSVFWNRSAVLFKSNNTVRLDKSWWTR